MKRVGLVLVLAACSGRGQVGTGEPGAGGSGAGGPDAAATMAGPDASAAADAPRPADVTFSRPDLPPTYTPVPGSCGLDHPAFCDTFESGPAEGGRSGELDPARWSVVRGMPYNSASFDDAFRIGPALIGRCRADLSNARVLPDHDVLVCDPIPTIPTRHALATAAAQNYGLATYRIRQPFDFAGRTGTIKLDLELSNNGLGGWPALILAEDPSPAPSFDWQERGSGPRNGIEIEFGTGWCNDHRSVEAIVYTFADYVQKSFPPPDDCKTAHASTGPDALNHVEVYVTQSRVEVYTSDVSPDGATFPGPHLLWAGDVSLPFTRGYVSLALRNHATMKYWLGSAATVRFDNVGFDGPAVTGWREYSAPDALTSYRGLPGCTMGGAACQWEGDVIPAMPMDSGRVECAKTVCTYDGEGRNVGYVIPNSSEKLPPVPLTFTGVSKAGATRARVVLAGIYPWFAWSGKFPPVTELDLRFRWNGGPWHDRNVTPIEASAFMDYFPALGGAGAGAGLLNQVITVDLAELRDGDNRLELEAAGTWTGTYRLMVTGVDLVLDDR